MADTTIRTPIECSGKTYFEKCLFSDEYNQRLFLDVLKFPGFRIIENRRDGDKWFRKAQIDPPLTGLPGPVAKLIGDKFSYTEEGTYDPSTGIYRFKVTPSTAADKTKTEGESHCEDNGPNSVLITKLSVNVKVMIVGSMVEDKILKDFRASLDAAAPFINQFVNGR